MSTRFKVVLIEEGLGNFGDMFYYTREALASAVDARIFEGAKCYANHPDKIEERVRPERAVQDIIGHFESVHIEDGNAGQALLVGELVLLESEQCDWAIKQIERSVSFSEKFGKEFVGFSINASGSAEKKPLAEFLRNGTIPKSALPKLTSAIDKGIDQVEICTKLTEAVSCDLVTQAGAKGRTLKMLEGARLQTMGLKAKKVTENEDEGAKQGADGKDGEHADADKDKELIKSMLKKYVGGEDHSEEMHQAMCQAYQNAQEAGMEGEEAEKAAGYSMKLAHHAAKKQAEAKQAEEGKAPPAAGDKKDDGDGDDDSKEADDAQPKEKKMEREVIGLKGQVASLTERLEKKEREEHLAKAIKESKLPDEIAKKFRESVKAKHTAEDITEMLKVFTEAYTSGAKASGFYVQPEKTNQNGSGGGLSFADCVKE